MLELLFTTFSVNERQFLRQKPDQPAEQPFSVPKSSKREQPETLQSRLNAPLGRRILATLGILLAYGHGFKVAEAAVQESPAATLSLEFGDTHLQLGEWKDFNPSSDSKPISIESKSLSILVEDTQPAYGTREQTIVHNPDKFDNWVMDHVRKNFGMLDGLGIPYTHPETATPRQLVSLAVRIVDRSFSYDETTTKNLATFKDASKLSASSHLRETTDATAVDELLEKRSTEVVCRHYAEAVKQVYQVLYQHFPQLANIRVQTVSGLENHHAWDAVVTINGPRSGTVFYIDPTSADSRGMTNVGEITGSDNSLEQYERFFYDTLSEKGMINRTQYTHELATHHRQGAAATALEGNDLQAANYENLEEKIAYIEEAEDFFKRPLEEQLAVQKRIGNTAYLLCVHRNVKELYEDPEVQARTPNWQAPRQVHIRAMIDLTSSQSEKKGLIAELQ